MLIKTTYVLNVLLKIVIVIKNCVKFSNVDFVGGFGEDVPFFSKVAQV